MSMMKIMKFLLISLVLCSMDCFAKELVLPEKWSALSKIVTDRKTQAERKMNLSEQNIVSLLAFLNSPKANNLNQLEMMQKQLPKTTLELLIAIQIRGLNPVEAEKMATYLQNVPSEYHVKDIAVFDENTSHLIGREWHEIDYSGENMTWSEQRAKYAPYGITNFKTLENLQKFFPVESKLPYFRQAYGDSRQSVTSDK